MLPPPLRRPALPALARKPAADWVFYREGEGEPFDWTGGAVEGGDVFFALPRETRNDAAVCPGGATFVYGRERRFYVPQLGEWVWLHHRAYARNRYNHTYL